MSVKSLNEGLLDIVKDVIQEELDSTPQYFTIADAWDIIDDGDDAIVEIENENESIGCQNKQKRFLRKPNKQEALDVHWDTVDNVVDNIGPIAGAAATIAPLLADAESEAKEHQMMRRNRSDFKYDDEFEEGVLAGGEKWKQGKDIYNFERRSRDEKNSILSKGKKFYTGKGTSDDRARATEIRDFGTDFYDAEDYYKNNLSTKYRDERRNRDDNKSGKIVEDIDNGYDYCGYHIVVEDASSKIVFSDGHCLEFPTSDEAEQFINENLIKR